MPVMRGGAQSIVDRLITSEKRIHAKIVVGKSIHLGLHGRLLYLPSRGGYSGMAADGLRDLVKLFAYPIYIRVRLAYLVSAQIEPLALISLLHSAS
jgi:hypothetical protein